MKITSHGFVNWFTVITISINCITVYLFLFSCCYEAFNLAFWMSCLNVSHLLIFKLSRFSLRGYKTFLLSIELRKSVKSCWHWLTHWKGIQLTGIDSYYCFVDIEFCTFSIKKFVFDNFIYTQAFKLSSELPLSKSELFFILHCLPDILKEYKSKFQNYIPIPEPTHIYSKCQNALFLHFYKDYTSTADTLIRVGVRFPNIYIQKFNFQIFTEIDLTYAELKYLCNHLTFLESYLEAITSIVNIVS